MTNETDIRPRILNSLLSTPHRELAALWPVHQEIAKLDIVFYSHLAAWYAVKGSIHDHNEVFVAVLSLGDTDFRDVGLALLRRLPPYQVARVVDYIKGREVTKRVLKAGHQPLKRVKGKPAPTKEQQEAAYETKTEKVGLFRNVPRSMRTEVARFLAERERDAAGLDKTILTARKSLKHLYATLRIKPGARAQAILFADQPPADSPFAVIKMLRGRTPDEQAQAIVDERIPYRVAVGIIDKMTPTVLAALINAMTPAEVLNSLTSLKERGALENADLKALVDVKLAAAQTDKRVAPMKAKKAAAQAKEQGIDLGEEMDQALEDVTQRQVTARGAITRSTALFIDKSSSMDPAIEVGKQLAALVSAICKAALHVYAFDTVAYTVTAKGTALADWERGLKGIRAGGSTSCGVALDWLRKQKVVVEQIVMVTDEGENSSPSFEAAYTAYARDLNVRPAVTLVRVKGSEGLHTKVTDACKRLGVDLHSFDFGGDYYALANVLPWLSQASLSDLVMEVLNWPLPERRTS